MKTMWITVAAIAFISSINAQTPISIKEADKHVGETVSICGTILSLKRLANVIDQPTLINLGLATDHLDVVMSTGKTALIDLSVDSLQYKNACITGKVYRFEGTQHAYLKAESIRLKQSEIKALPVFKEKTTAKVSTPEPALATENSNVRKKIVLNKNKFDPQKNALLIKYIKVGRILSFTETKETKTYVILLNDYKDL